MIRVCWYLTLLTLIVATGPHGNDTAAGFTLAALAVCILYPYLPKRSKDQ